MPTRLKLAVLPVLCLALQANACDSGRLASTLPAKERAEQVAYPVVPPGEAVCDGAPCLSDRQTGGLIASLTDALDEANARLQWLHDWIDVASKSAR